jgi:hypothetical protein
VQHRAGVTPIFGELDEMFERAAEVRAGLNAIDQHGLTPPVVVDGAGATLVFERVTPTAVVVNVADAARAVLESLARAPRAAGGR